MNDSRKHIGILGLGARSTEYYIQQQNSKYHKFKGDYHTFPFLLFNIDFNDINPYLPNNFEALIPRLENYIKELEKLPITFLIVPNITLHEALDKLESDMSIIHPLTLTIQQLQNKNIKSAMIVGSKYTMSSNYLRSYLEKINVEVLYPSEDEQIEIDNFRKLVYAYNETERDIIEFQKLIDHFASNATVIIACTELSIFTNEIKDNLNIIDMADLQIQKALALMS